MGVTKRTPATVWVVAASTGDHSDRLDWDVAVYPDEKSAIMHAALAEARAKAYEFAVCEHGERMLNACDKCKRDWHDITLLRNHMGALDPRCFMDHAGTIYVAISVPWRARAPGVDGKE